MCTHEAGHFHINVQNFGDTNLRYLEITGRCKRCDAPIIFRCDHTGVSPDRPMASIGRDEVTLPFLFDGETYDGRAIGFVATRVA